jgi:hypothetical protein
MHVGRREVEGEFLTAQEVEQGHRVGSSGERGQYTPAGQFRECGEEMFRKSFQDHGLS